MFDQASDTNTPELLSGISVLVPLIGDQYESLTETDIHRVSEKNKQNYFCYNYVNLPPNLIIFGKKMANGLKLYEVHLFSITSNLCQ